MAKNQFVHLHCHTGGSVLDGHANVKEMVEEAAKLGQPAIASTDHGTMHFSYDLWKEAQAAGIKGIVGIEAYMTPGDAPRTDKEAIFFGARSKEERMEGAQDVSAGGAYTHMTMLAENNEGMHNLFKLSSLAWADGYYKKPRMDIEIVSQYSKGIIATTGCPSGELQTRLRLGQWDEAVKYVDKMQSIFGKENYFLELMDHDMKVDIERVVRDDLLKIGKHMNIPLLATNDLHYTRRDQARSHEQMLAVQSGSKMTDATYDNGGKRFAFDGDEFYVKSADEMEAVFGHLPESITNTLWIAERCNVSFEYKDDLRPNVEFPAGMSETEFIKSEAFEGLHRRLPQFANDQRYIDRLNMELGVLDMKGYNGYFLVTSDFVRWAKNNEIKKVETGYGRGCLSADTNILTPNGFVKINEIKVGDTVFNENGEQVVVPQVFAYDCDEELIEIKAFYGSHGNKMTDDHKVLVSKAIHQTDKKKLSGGVKFATEINEPKWIRADEVEVGDLVVMPKIQLKETDDSFEVEPVSITAANVKYPHSVREIAKHLNVARSTVMKFFASNGAVKGEVSQRIHDYFVDNKLNVQEEISKRLTVKTLPVTKVEKNFDAGFLFGLFISDGWIRSDRDTEIGFAQRRSEDEGQIPAAFHKVFGVDLTPYHHKESDLTQYNYNHKGIAKLFADIFPEYQFTAQSKYIPDTLLNSPEEFRKGLLEGLWYGDGTHKGKSSYGTSSKRLAEDVFLLLTSLGLPASLKAHERTETRPEFNKAQRESFVEYKVGTVKDFDLNKIRNGKGFDGKFNYYRVREVNVVPSEGKVYDFTVPGTHSYVTDSYVVHNSAGGSLVSFCLDITDLDPIRFDLLFERFINPERDSPPDIDMDFDDIGRDRVIKYVTEKYGSDKVAQIVTFGRIKAKNAIKDVIRILDEPYALGDILTKQLPPDVAGKAIKLYEVFDKNHPRYHEGENFREAVSKLENKTIIPSALGLEGRMRSTGVHAAGVIISSKNLVETIPLFTRQKDNLTITAFDYPTCESLGLLKFDFLGIRNLTIVAKAMEHIKRIHGIELDAVDIVTGPMDDKKTYELFQRGETLGIFQLDSAGMRSLLKIFNPTEIGDISAILALYRPGPMGMNSHIAYADRKNGRAPIVSPHPELKELFDTVMGDTFGICTYQEQLMKAAQVVAGYSLAQADNLRRAMGKKKKEVLEAEYIPFSEGMRNNGYSDEAIKALWDIFVPFAEYGFNKSHSAGYALLSYVTAYLKANYPAEYMSALLSCTMTDKDKTATYLEECRRMGIKVSPPHVSKSLIEYTPVSEKEILIGMEAIRGVGYEVAKGIMEAAQEEPFESLTDFMSRVPSHALSKGVIEGLIDAGGFDSFGYTRRSLAACLPDLARNFSKQKKTEEKGQFDLFSMIEEVSVPEIDIPALPEYSKKDKLARERHVLGLYVSDHPLSGMADTLDSYVSNHIVDIATGDLVASEGFGDRKAKVAFAGVVGNLVRKPSRKGDMFASFTIEDMTGIVDAVMFPKSYEQFGHLLEPDGIIVARGSLMLRGEDEVNFAIDSVEPIETTHSGEIPFVINLKKEQTTEESLNALGDVLQRYKGEQKVQIHVAEETEIKVYELDDSFKIKVAQGLRNEITYLFGLNWM